MSTKTKIFSLLVLVLLFLPVVFNPGRSGQVLGTTEQTGGANTNQTGIFSSFSQPKTESPAPSAQASVPVKSEMIGDIASGVRTLKEDAKPNMDTVYTGKAIVNMNTTLDASSDKFPLGSSIKITHGDKEMNVVIQGKSVLAADTLVVLDKESFEKLGGDLATGSIEISVNPN